MKISLAQASECGIKRVRNPIWANKFDHIEIDIINGKVGPWLHLYCPFNLQCNGKDPVNFLWITGPIKIDINAIEFEAYIGPLPDSDAYASEIAKFEPSKKSS